MKNETKNNWNWPESLDALKAAPEHHKLLLENDSVRVLDTLIKPGDITKVHTHKWPATYYILSWSDFVRRDENDQVVLDSRNLESPPKLHTALWSEPLPPHTLENVGSADIHLISVELKN
ncbi:hypothetical protein [Gaetbulibacter aestuarii]|uniref:Cupin n=1 Tax=Gaetbulibacter aestuarii TaxID=1502358 RepID=A0ABW7MYF4_9FLAO